MTPNTQKGVDVLRERILEGLREIETEYDVRVCYAVEAGSRAWGLASKESDFDVRFIYVHHKDWYLSIDEKRDVIELPIHHSLDINGWDLRKALRLLRKSNPPLLEWLQSDIIYFQQFSVADKMKAVQDEIFQPKSIIHHYLNMAKRNFREYLQRQEVKIKKYFNVLRPILACIWVEKFHTAPPVKFQTLLEELITEPVLMEEINSLLERKINGDELKIEPKTTIINNFVEKEIERIQACLIALDSSRKENFTAQLDALFKDALNEVWM